MEGLTVARERLDGDRVGTGGSDIGAVLYQCWVEEGALRMRIIHHEHLQELSGGVRDGQHLRGAQCLAQGSPIYCAVVGLHTGLVHFQSYHPDFHLLGISFVLVGSFLRDSRGWPELWDCFGFLWLLWLLALDGLLLPQVGEGSGLAVSTSTDSEVDRRNLGETEATLVLAGPLVEVSTALSSCTLIVLSSQVEGADVVRKLLVLPHVVLEEQAVPGLSMHLVMAEVADDGCGDKGDLLLDGNGLS